jgi:hypothetical protein
MRRAGPVALSSGGSVPGGDTGGKAASLSRRTAITSNVRVGGSSIGSKPRTESSRQCKTSPPVRRDGRRCRSQARRNAPRQGAASASRSPFSSPPGVGGTRFGGFALILDDTAMSAQRNQSLRTTRRPIKIPFWATGPHAMPPFRLGCGLARHPVKSQPMAPFYCSTGFALAWRRFVPARKTT